MWQSKKAVNAKLPQLSNSNRYAVIRAAAIENIYHILFICLCLAVILIQFFQTSTNAQPPQPPTNTTAMPTRLASTLVEALLVIARPVS